MTLYQTINAFKEIALRQPNVNYSEEGNVYDLMNGNPSSKFASVILTQTTHTTDETFDTYGFHIFYIDRLMADMESNRQQIQSVGMVVLNNIIQTFTNLYDAEIEQVTFQPFTQHFTCETAGDYVTVNVRMPKIVICGEVYGE